MGNNSINNIVRFLTQEKNGKPSVLNKMIFKDSLKESLIKKVSSTSDKDLEDTADSFINKEQVMIDFLNEKGSNDDVHELFAYYCDENDTNNAPIISTSVADYSLHGIFQNHNNKGWQFVTGPDSTKEDLLCIFWLVDETEKIPMEEIDYEEESDIIERFKDLDKELQDKIMNYLLNSSESMVGKIKSSKSKDLESVADDLIVNYKLSKSNFIKKMDNAIDMFYQNPENTKYNLVPDIDLRYGNHFQNRGYGQGKEIWDTLVKLYGKEPDENMPFVDCEIYWNDGVDNRAEPDDTGVFISHGLVWEYPYEEQPSDWIIESMVNRVRNSSSSDFNETADDMIDTDFISEENFKRKIKSQIRKYFQTDLWIDNHYTGDFRVFWDSVNSTIYGFDEESVQDMWNDFIKEQGDKIEEGNCDADFEIYYNTECYAEPEGHLGIFILNDEILTYKEWIKKRDGLKESMVSKIKSSNSSDLNTRVDDLIFEPTELDIFSLFKNNYKTHKHIEEYSHSQIDDDCNPEDDWYKWYNSLGDYYFSDKFFKILELYYGEEIEEGFDISARPLGNKSGIEFEIDGNFWNYKSELKEDKQKKLLKTIYKFLQRQINTNESLVGKIKSTSSTDIESNADSMVEDIDSEVKNKLIETPENPSIKSFYYFKYFKENKEYKAIKCFGRKFDTVMYINPNCDSVSLRVLRNRHGKILQRDNMYVWNSRGKSDAIPFEMLSSKQKSVILRLIDYKMNESLVAKVSKSSSIELDSQVDSQIDPRDILFYLREMTIRMNNGTIDTFKHSPLPGFLIHNNNKNKPLFDRFYSDFKDPQGKSLTHIFFNMNREIYYIFDNDENLYLIEDWGWTSEQTKKDILELLRTNIKSLSITESMVSKIRSTSNTDIEYEVDSNILPDLDYFLKLYKDEIKYTNADDIPCLIAVKTESNKHLFNKLDKMCPDWCDKSDMYVANFYVATDKSIQLWFWEKIKGTKKQWLDRYTDCELNEWKFVTEEMKEVILAILKEGSCMKEDRSLEESLVGKIKNTSSTDIDLTVDSTLDIPTQIGEIIDSTGFLCSHFKQKYFPKPIRLKDWNNIKFDCIVKMRTDLNYPEDFEFCPLNEKPGEIVLYNTRKSEYANIKYISDNDRLQILTSLSNTNESMTRKIKKGFDFDSTADSQVVDYESLIQDIIREKGIESHRLNGTVLRTGMLITYIPKQEGQNEYLNGRIVDMNAEFPNFIIPTDKFDFMLYNDGVGFRPTEEPTRILKEVYPYLILSMVNKPADSETLHFKFKGMSPVRHTNPNKAKNDPTEQYTAKDNYVTYLKDIPKELKKLLYDYFKDKY